MSDRASKGLPEATHHRESLDHMIPRSNGNPPYNHNLWGSALRHAPYDRSRFKWLFDSESKRYALCYIIVTSRNS